MSAGAARGQPRQTSLHHALAVCTQTHTLCTLCVYSRSQFRQLMETKPNPSSINNESPARLAPISLVMKNLAAREGDRARPPPEAKKANRRRQSPSSLSLLSSHTSGLSRSLHYARVDDALMLLAGEEPAAFGRFGGEEASRGCVLAALFRSPSSRRRNVVVAMACATWPKPHESRTNLAISAELDTIDCNSIDSPAYRHRHKQQENFFGDPLCQSRYLGSGIAPSLDHDRAHQPHWMAEREA